MKTVWIVSWEDYDEFEISGVFLTETAAQNYKKKISKHYRVTEDSTLIRIKEFEVKG